VIETQDGTNFRVFREVFNHSTYGVPLRHVHRPLVSLEKGRPHKDRLEGRKVVLELFLGFLLLDTQLLQDLQLSLEDNFKERGIAENLLYFLEGSGDAVLDEAISEATVAEIDGPLDGSKV